MKHFELRFLKDLKVVSDYDRENLRLTGYEGSWLTSIKIPSDILSPVFHQVSHRKETVFQKEHTVIPIRKLMYRNQKNVLAFVQNYDIRMSIEWIKINGIDMVLVFHGAYDNPKDPLVLESYLNPYFEEDGELNFLDELFNLAHSGMCLCVGHTFRNGNYNFEGISYFQATDEFQERAKEIYRSLVDVPKIQSANEFLYAKILYQQQHPLDHRKINWLGGFSKSIRIREFL